MIMFNRYIHMSNLIRLFSSNLFSLLYVNHTHTQREIGKEYVCVCVCVCVHVCMCMRERQSHREEEG